MRQPLIVFYSLRQYTVEGRIYGETLVKELEYGPFDGKSLGMSISGYDEDHFST